MNLKKKRNKTSFLLVDSIKGGLIFCLIFVWYSLIFWFRGGSGINVLGPPTPDDSLFGQIQRSASQAGAISESSSSTNSRRITIYRNGFTVDDGPLRDPHAPENTEFISDLGRGLVPRGYYTGLLIKISNVWLMFKYYCRICNKWRNWSWLDR